MTSLPQATNAVGSGPRVVLDISPEDEGLLTWSEQLLVGEWMSAAGFEFFVADRATFAPDSADRAYTLLEQFPYDAPAEGIPYAPRVRSTIQGPDPNNDYLQSLSPAARVAFVLGAQMPSQGCSADARRQLYRDLETFLVSTYTSNLTFITRFATGADPRVVVAVAKWSTCMSTSGFEFAAACGAVRVRLCGDATRSRRHAMPPPDPKPVTLSRSPMPMPTAPATQTSAPSFRGAHGEHFNQLIDENAELLSQYAAARATAIERATALLADS